jgi:hypothetical protein
MIINVIYDALGSKMRRSPPPLLWNRETVKLPVDFAELVMLQCQFLEDQPMLPWLVTALILSGQCCTTRLTECNFARGSTVSIRRIAGLKELLFQSARIGL